MLLGAGDGNRTRVISLEGWSSTIELHPHKCTEGKMVGTTGFEPATSCSQSRRATKLRHVPPFQLLQYTKLSAADEYFLFKFTNRRTSQRNRATERHPARTSCGKARTGTPAPSQAHALPPHPTVSYGSQRTLMAAGPTAFRR